MINPAGERYSKQPMSGAAPSMRALPARSAASVIQSAAAPASRQGEEDRSVKSPCAASANFGSAAKLPYSCSKRDCADVLQQFT